MESRSFRNLVWFFLAFGLTVFAGIASAQDKYVIALIQGTYAYALERTPACQSAFDTVQGRGGLKGYTFAGSNSTQFTCRGIAPGATAQETIGSWSNRTCTVAEPFFNYYNGCSAKKVDPPGTVPPVTEPPDPCADKNPFIRRWNYGPSGSYGSPTNYAGCVITPIEMLTCRVEPAGTRYCMWMVKRTGAKYNGPDTPGLGGNDTPEKPDDPPVKSPPINAPPAEPDAPPDTNRCPRGTVYGGLSWDGEPMCMGTGTGTPDKKTPPKVEVEKTETNPDGSTTTTKTSTTTNSDGSTTKNTTTTTTKSDGSTETGGSTETTKTPSGGAGKADRPPEDDKYDLCKTNPNLSICRESSVNGSCGQIQCVGDVIQCATLRAAAAMECKQRADEVSLKASPLASKGQAAIDGTDLTGLPSPKNGQVVNLPQFETQGWLGAGSAFADVSITVQGHQVVIPLSKWSEYLLPLRYVLMIVSSLISFRILSGAVLKE